MLALSPFALRLVKASFHAARGRLRRHPAARPRRQPPLLRHRGGAGGPRGLQGEAHARLLAVPATAVSAVERQRRAHLADGRAAADAARGGRARARRHRAGARREGTFKRAARSSPRCSARCSSRSARTSPTTTPTRAAAPTPRTGSGPVRVTAGGLVPPRAGADRDLRRVRAGRAGRRLPDRRPRAGSCCWSAPRRSSPACSTPAARGRTATRASARCSCSCSSASSRSPAPTSRRSRSSTWEAFVLAVPVGLLAARDPRGQQRARPRDRPARGQADARGAARARRARAALYAAMVYGAFADRAAAVAARRRRCRRGCCCRWLALPLAVPVVRIVRNAHRRAGAQRRARAHRACCSSCSACCSRRGSCAS